MKFISALLPLLLTATLLSAQTDRVYLIWDLSKPASFPGGQLAFRDYFKNIPYPTDTTSLPNGNRLVVGFVVEHDGIISELRIFQTPGPAFTAAVIKAMQGKKWNSAEANGHSVRQLMYGCGEEALRLTRLLKNWVPAQVFDSTYASSHEFIYVFCPDPAAIETSDKLYTESEILPPDSKYDNQLLAHTKPVFLNAKYVLGEDFNLVPYNNAFRSLSCGPISGAIPFLNPLR